MEKKNEDFILESLQLLYQTKSRNPKIPNGRQENQRMKNKVKKNHWVGEGRFSLKVQKKPARKKINKWFEDLYRQ